MGHLANLVTASRRQPVIDDPLLNRLGLQVARTVGARVVWRARRLHPDPSVAHLADELRATGLVVVHDALPQDDFDAVRSAADELLASTTPRLSDTHGSNLLQSIWRADMDEERRAILDRFFTLPLLHRLGEAAEGWPQEPAAGRCLLQRVDQVAGAPDRESDAHSDTFFSTHKAWLYLTDVTEADGPLFYYPGSHRLTATSLRGIYRESVTAAAGARRIDERELEKRGLERVELLCPKNTLVVANTFGYHGRCQGRPPGSRTALHVELRTEPFRRASRLPTDRSRAQP